MPIATPGHPIIQDNLKDLATLAAGIGCPPAGQPAYRWDAYKLDENDPNEVPARRWLTELTRLHADVSAAALGLCNASLASPLDPSVGCVSGPWIIPPGHSLFWVNGWGGPVLSFGDEGGVSPNLGRRAVGVKLWSRGVVTPMRVMCQVTPMFEFELDGETTVPASSTASWAYTRPAKTAGCFFVSVVVQDTTVSLEDTENPNYVDIKFSGSPEAMDVTEMPGSPQVLSSWDVDGVTHYTIWRFKRGSWGTCLNDGGSENHDIFNRESGITGQSFTVGYTVSGMTSESDYVQVDKGFSGQMSGFSVSAHYGELDGGYPATEKAAISEDAWFVSEEDPVFKVTGDVLVNGVRRTGFGNICWLWCDAWFGPPENLPETWVAPETQWEAMLWPVGNMRRGAAPGETFTGQAAPATGSDHGYAVPQCAADGLWVQSAADAELSMDTNGPRRQTDCWGAALWRPAIDYVTLTRRKPYGTSPAVDVEIGCWRGAGEGREFTPLLTVTLPANVDRTRIDLVTLAGFESLLPVYDNLSIGHTNADRVTVRLGNWKGIGENWEAINEPPWVRFRLGSVAADGTPARLVNDLEDLIGAAT